jgi:hypothetical protein
MCFANSFASRGLIYPFVCPNGVIVNIIQKQNKL